MNNIDVDIISDKVNQIEFEKQLEKRFALYVNMGFNPKQLYNQLLPFIREQLQVERNKREVLQKKIEIQRKLLNETLESNKTLKHDFEKAMKSRAKFWREKKRYKKKGKKYVKLKCDLQNLLFSNQPFSKFRSELEEILFANDPVYRIPEHLRKNARVLHQGDVVATVACRKVEDRE